MRLAIEVERLESRLGRVGIGDAKAAPEALERLETALDAASAAVKRLSARATAESLTESERRSDGDWRNVTATGEGRPAPEETRGGEPGSWSEY